MKIQSGKIYQRRDGKITGELISSDTLVGFPFRDPKYRQSYTSEGRSFNSLRNDESPANIIGEWDNVLDQNVLDPLKVLINPFDKIFWS